MSFRSPPYRAEHLGSLLRPEKLLQIRRAIHNGTAPISDLPAIEQSSIREATQLQIDLNFHGITDGEYGRHMFWGTFFPSLNGMTQITNPPREIFRPYAPDVAAFLEEDAVPGETVICTGKISHTGKSSYIDQYTFLRSIVPEGWREGIKLTLAAPTWYHLRYREGKAYPSDVYKNDAEYFSDIAAAYRTELSILYDAGLRNVQIDDPNLAYFCSEKMLHSWPLDSANTHTPDEVFNSYIGLYNACLLSKPRDMHVGIHLCRGNFVGSRHFSEGGYDRIATRLFQNLNVDTFYLEYDTERAGGFEPLKELPRDKNVVLGVVSSKFPTLEGKGEMVRRVREAAEFVAKSGEGRDAALKRMGVSPQCGFASHEEGNALGWGDMVEKLRLVRSVADEVWPGEY
ncbi:5-methyltetrahydropteroyltriglutamate-homocysteine methyltransferase [Piedraia hortae CBS 480.64]|uniref:5-methyltetrahydropteroyltriglutamate-homocysteine methyltransferase n=1 Tax=Piedraia hortae CBS 480.64 TaxID=1314780 RepID=A0A6A7BWF9_9PEZI|nr:5-methyltetrahydropteroyltriglutamate-homocysteine methyltransferase [Piedraia hortae CBS 480.64]